MKIITFLRFEENLHSFTYRDKKDSISGTKAAAFEQRRNQAMSIRLGNIFKSSTVGLMTALVGMTTSGFAQGDATKMADIEAGNPNATMVVNGRQLNPNNIHYNAALLDAEENGYTDNDAAEAASKDGIIIWAMRDADPTNVEACKGALAKRGYDKSVKIRIGNYASKDIVTIVDFETCGYAPSDNGLKMGKLLTETIKEAKGKLPQDAPDQYGGKFWTASLDR